MNLLWLSIRSFLTNEKKNTSKEGPFCFSGYSGEFSVSDYLRRMSELSARLVKERIEVPKPKLTFAPFSSDLSIETSKKPNALIRAVLQEKGEPFPEANLTGCRREEWEQRMIADIHCIQAQPLSDTQYRVESHSVLPIDMIMIDGQSQLTDCCCMQSTISKLRESIEEQRFSAAQSAQNQVLRGLLEQNQRLKTVFDSVNLPIIATMLGVQASDCFRKPCETPYSNIPRGLFG